MQDRGTGAERNRYWKCGRRKESTTKGGIKGFAGAPEGWGRGQGSSSSNNFFPPRPKLVET